MAYNYKGENKPRKQKFDKDTGEAIGYIQGYYALRNPKKYVGNPTEIIFRSSWEKMFCHYADTNEDIVAWSSEPFEIPYYNPISKSVKKYFVDFYIKTRNSKGEETKWLIEVKPSRQTIQPVLEGARKTVKKMVRYNKDMEAYAINRMKWKSARKYAEENGYKFAIMTEKEFPSWNNR